MSYKLDLSRLPDHALHKRTQLLQECRNMITDKKFIVLDTETTGLQNDDEIVQIAILDPFTMKPLIDTLVKPTQPIPKEATAIHGITDWYVSKAPTFKKIYRKLSMIFDKADRVVIYNAEFDMRMLSQSRKAYGLQPFSIETDQSKVTCAMAMFSSFVGEWNRRKNDFKWQRLPRAGHRAFQDCIATLNVLRCVASGKESKFIGDLLCECGFLKGLHSDHWGHFSYCPKCGQFVPIEPVETSNLAPSEEDNDDCSSIDCDKSDFTASDYTVDEFLAEHFPIR